MNNLLHETEKNTITTLNSIEEAYTNTLTEQTKRCYISTVKEFFHITDINLLSIEAIRSVTPEVANAWANQLRENGLSKATINKKLSSMGNFYTFLSRRNIGIVEYNPFDTNEGCIRFKNAIKPYSSKRSISPEEMSKVFEIAENNIPTNKHTNKYLLAMRDLIVLELLATTGARRGELVSITLGDIKTNYGKVTIEILGKGDKNRIVVIPKKVKSHIDSYVKSRGLTYNDKELPLITQFSSNYEPNQFVSEMTIYRIVKKFADKADIGVEEISPHNFRHAFATNAIDIGVGEDLLQDLMGHSNRTTTRRYVHSHRVVTENPSDKLAELYNL